MDSTGNCRRRQVRMHDGQPVFHNRRKVSYEELWALLAEDTVGQCSMEGAGTDAHDTCPPLRTCQRCFEDMIVEEDFAITLRKGKLHRDKVCRQCRSAARKVRPTHERYGLTATELAALGTKCHICGTEQNLCIDHDHTTKLVRGRLCANCNAGLGFFAEDVIRLQKAIEYLVERKQTPS